VSKDSLLGILAADNNRSGKKIIDEEKELMVSLANQVAMAIENARSFQMIEDLNVNLEKKVSDRTEELDNPINFAYNGITALRESLKKIHALSQQCVQTGGAISKKDHDTMQTKLLNATRDAEKLMEIIDAGLNRTRNLVLDLKHFSRKGMKDPEFLLIRNLIETALTILNHEISGRITVHKDFRFSEHIQGFPEQLNQVFLNVLLNSIQAISEKGNIWIRTESAGHNEVRISIRDDGTGIRKEDLPKIFEPFFTTKRSGQGTGLGMSICQRIIDNHGGKFMLNSEEGVGTEVIMTLPVRLNAPVKNGDASGGSALGKD
jgi:signal transduction histidine kinase